MGTSKLAQQASHIFDKNGTQLAFNIKDNIGGTQRPLRGIVSRPFTKEVCNFQGKIENPVQTDRALWPAR
jgi:hypothetical protein